MDEDEDDEKIDAIRMEGFDLGSDSYQSPPVGEEVTVSTSGRRRGA